MNLNLAERLRSYAQNEEMIDQHFTTHGRDCEAAAELLSDLLAALVEYVERHEASCNPEGLPEYDQAVAAIAEALGAA